VKNPVLSAIHFQLTGRCNLRCTFCGQQNGMFAAREPELQLADWQRIADDLPAGAVITLWGGEPLVCPFFDDLADDLYRRGFRLRIVTNGTLIDRHAALLNRAFEVINVSLDGPAADHDRFRGPGVFDRVKDNLKQLSSRQGKLVFLTTVADATVGRMAELPLQLAPLHPDEIVLQQLMYLSSAEIADYRRWLRDVFQQTDPTLDVWRRDDDFAYRTELAHQCELVKTRCYPVPVTLRMHDCLTPFARPCNAACWRAHVKYNGDVLYCTDFYGFTAGNIRQVLLSEIFHNARSQKFRAEIAAGHNPLCRHCAWHGNNETIVLSAPALSHG